MAFLLVLLFFWMDEVFIKTKPEILTYQYEIAKIFIHTSIAYLVVKYIFKLFKLNNKFKEKKQSYFFVAMFLLFNSYIVCQYISRTVSTRIIHQKLRKSLSPKLEKTKSIGTGYEAKHLSFEEYFELNKNNNLPSLPNSAFDIYVYDWYEIQDFRRIVKFNLDADINLNLYYKDESSTLGKIKRLEPFELIEDSKNSQKFDPEKFIRYKWEVGEI